MSSDGCSAFDDLLKNNKQLRIATLVTRVVIFLESFKENSVFSLDDKFAALDAVARIYSSGSSNVNNVLRNWVPETGAVN